MDEELMQDLVLLHHRMYGTPSPDTPEQRQTLLAIVVLQQGLAELVQEGVERHMLQTALSYQWLRVMMSNRSLNPKVLEQTTGDALHEMMQTICNEVMVFVLRLPDEPEREVTQDKWPRVLAASPLANERLSDADVERNAILVDYTLTNHVATLRDKAVDAAVIEDCLLYSYVQVASINSQAPAFFFPKAERHWPSIAKKMRGSLDQLVRTHGGDSPPAMS